MNTYIRFFSKNIKIPLNLKNILRFPVGTPIDILTLWMDIIFSILNTQILSEYIKIFNGSARFFSKKNIMSGG